MERNKQIKDLYSDITVNITITLIADFSIMYFKKWNVSSKSRNKIVVKLELFICKILIQ